MSPLSANAATDAMFVTIETKDAQSFLLFTLIVMVQCLQSAVAKYSSASV